MPCTAPISACSLGELEQPRLQVRADVARVLLQPLVAQDVEHGQPDHAADTGLPPADEKK